jgi:diaminopimelate epimerase
MQGLGNDFVFLDGADLSHSSTGRFLLANWSLCAPHLARIICDRRRGIGADALILSLNLSEHRQSEAARSLYGEIDRSAQLSWSYTNSDGSAAKICGNGLRCLALWADRRALVPKKFVIFTAIGPVQINFRSEQAIEVRLPGPNLHAESIPFSGASNGEKVIGMAVSIENRALEITCVNVGNPHCVIFLTGRSSAYGLSLPLSLPVPEPFFPPELAAIARALQAHQYFPEGVNVEFAWPISPKSAEMIVWERGCQATLACGSAALATLVAGALEGKLDHEATITLPGGTLTVGWEQKTNKLSMLGAAAHVFDGQIVLPNELLDSLSTISQAKADEPKQTNLASAKISPIELATESTLKSRRSSTTVETS